MNNWFLDVHLNIKTKRGAMLKKVLLGLFVFTLITTKVYSTSSIKLPTVKIGLLYIATKDISFKPIREGGIEKNYWAGAREACKANGMRLPTPEELDAIYTLRGLLGKFKPADYWTSKSINNDEALAIAFYDVSISDGGKVKINGVMPKNEYEKPRASLGTTESGLSFYQDKNDPSIMARCVR